MRRPRNGKVLKSFWRQNAPSIVHPLIMCICISCSIYPSLAPPVSMCVCVCGGCHCVACLSTPRGASIKISYHYRKGNRHPKLGSKSGPPHGDKARQMDRILTGIHKQSAPTPALYYPHTLPSLCSACCCSALSLRMCPGRGHSAGHATRCQLLRACCKSTSLS